MAPDGGLAIIRALDSSGNGLLSDCTVALGWILDKRSAQTDIVNMSLGSFALYSDIYDSADADTVAMGAAVGALRGAGILLVASAGNQGRDGSMVAPACLRNVVAVGGAYDANLGAYIWSEVCTGATAAAQRHACFSDTSERSDVVGPRCETPGGKSPDSATSIWCGTSQAAPHVAAVAALIEGRTSFLGAFELEH